VKRRNEMKTLNYQMFISSKMDYSVPRR